MDAGISQIENLSGPRGTVEQVAERIRTAIVSGKLSPGTWLREVALSSRLGVSRIPVREALTRLESEGLVERVPFRGARVVRLTVDQVRESFQLRSVLEGFAAKLATPRLSSEEIGRLREIIGRLEDCVRANDQESLPALHAEFHSLINERCGSTKLIRWINELYNQFPKSSNRITRLEEPAQEYRGIVEAIVAGDGELAGRLMSEHNEKGCQASIEYYIRILGD